MAKEYPDSNALFDIEKYDRTVQRTARVINCLWGTNIVGINNIPEEGAAIIDISHRSLMDPWLAAIAAARAKRHIRGMVKEEVLNWYYFGLGSHYFAKRGIFFVNRKNTGRETWNLAANILRSGETLAMAEEGTHKNKGPILGESKDGVARLAVKMEAEGVACPVVPLGMSTEGIHKHLFRPINFVIGEALHADIALGATIKEQKVAAEEFGEEVHRGLQTVFNEANE
jgi:1-acyl-sn-glycerol-3-phosphate acyltransferase